MRLERQSPSQGTSAAGRRELSLGWHCAGQPIAGDRVIYDTSSGRLYYDHGTGAAPALIMATLQGAPPLAATDFTVW